MLSELSIPLLVLHAIGCTGLVIVVSLGTAAAPLRKLWPQMLGCPMCFGVWAGTFWGYLLMFHHKMPAWLSIPFDATAFSFCVSLLGFLVGVFDYCAEKKE